jgi:RNA recognition motif-containing protein
LFNTFLKYNQIFDKLNFCSVSPSKDDHRHNNHYNDHRERDRDRDYDNRERVGVSRRSGDVGGRSRSYERSGRVGSGVNDRDRSYRRSRSPVSNRNSNTGSSSSHRDRDSKSVNNSSSSRSDRDRDNRHSDSKSKIPVLKFKWERTVYVSNLPSDMKWSDLKDLFRRKVCDVMFCDIFLKDGKSLGFGCLEFKSVRDAERAVDVMHHYEIDGRRISCRLDHDGRKTEQALEDAFNPPRRTNTNGSSNSSSNNRKRSTTPPRNGSYRNSNNNNQLNNSNPILDPNALSTLTATLTQTLANSLLNVQNPLIANANNLLNNNPILLNQIAAQLKIDGPVTNRLYVSNLDFRVEEQKLKEVYSLAGNVTHVSIFRDRDNRPRGMAIVEYETSVEALNAISMLNKHMLNDRQMQVRFDNIKHLDESSSNKPGILSSNNMNGNMSNQSKLPSGLKSIGAGINPSNFMNGNGLLPTPNIGSLLPNPPQMPLNMNLSSSLPALPSPQQPGNPLAAFGNLLSPNFDLVGLAGGLTNGLGLGNPGLGKI